MEFIFEDEDDDIEFCGVVVVVVLFFLIEEECLEDFLEKFDGNLDMLVFFMV